MRAKITFKTNMSSLDLQARFQDNQWWPDFEQRGENAFEIRNRILATVAMEHIGRATDGAKYIIYNERTKTEGLISEEQGEIVIRLLNENVTALQIASEDIVVNLNNFCDKNAKMLKFLHKIEILETKNRNTVIEGTVLVGFRNKFGEAIRNKRLELTIAVGGFIALVSLLIITYINRDLSAIQDTSVRWLIDICGKLIGSAFITTVSAALNFWFFYNSIHKIAWKIPSLE